jgi:hypothetical protein
MRRASSNVSTSAMSALGQKRIWMRGSGMSALPPTADILCVELDVG